MFITPMDLQDKPFIVNQKKETIDFQYTSKLRSAFISFVLFIVFSQKVSYQILQLLLGTFTNVTVTNDDCPNFLGLIIMATIIAFAVFLT